MRYVTHEVVFCSLFCVVFVLQLRLLKMWPQTHHVEKSSQICTEHKSCEIDPVKLKESENLETNRVRSVRCGI